MLGQAGQHRWSAAATAGWGVYTYHARTRVCSVSEHVKELA